MSDAYHLQGMGELRFYGGRFDGLALPSTYAPPYIRVEETTCGGYRLHEVDPEAVTHRCYERRSSSVPPIHYHVVLEQHA